MTCSLQPASSRKDNSISLMESSLPSPILADISESNNSFYIDKLFNLRTEYQNHALFDFLNINSRNKIIDLRVLMDRCITDAHVIEETNLNSDFQTESFLVNNYQKPFSRDRYEFSGGIVLHARKGVVCNRVPVLDAPSLEILCSELIVSKKKWIFVVYIGPQNPVVSLLF